MKTWVALLRGINVGGNKRVAMASLRKLLESLGYDDVRTLLQSGNAVFAATGTESRLQTAIETAIDEQLGLSVKVIVRSASDLAAVIDANPFIGIDPRQLGYVFVSDKVPAAKVKDVGDVTPDAFALGDRVIYLHRPNGVMASRLPDWSKVLGLTITERNGATTTKLRDLAQRPN